MKRHRPMPNDITSAAAQIALLISGRYCVTCGKEVVYWGDRWRHKPDWKPNG